MFYVMDLFSLVEELLIEETGLEEVIEGVRDFNVDTGVLWEDKHEV